MGNYRIFCYNPDLNGASSEFWIEGTEQYGNISVATDTSGNITNPVSIDPSLQWWNGPDEDLRYIIAYSSENSERSNGPENALGIDFPCNLGFIGSSDKTDVSFFNLVKVFTNNRFASISEAKAWLNDNGFWTSWTPTNFTSTWDTELGDGLPRITLPLIEGTEVGSYDFTVDWGDGETGTIIKNEDGFIIGNTSHTYRTGGVYTVTISGRIIGWSFNQEGDCAKLTEINNLGQLRIGDTGYAFGGCENLTLVSGILDLTKTASLAGLFYNCSSLIDVTNINSWEVFSVTSMNNMFDGVTLFNQDISSWDVSSVTDMSLMFNNATSFNTDISSWDVSSVNYMSFMFKNATSFNQPLNSWDVSSVLDMRGVFETATSFNQNINSWYVANVTDMNGMFTNAISFNQDISAWDISLVTDMSNFMTGKSTSNYSYYDNLLNSWSSLTLQSGLTWDMGEIQYSSAASSSRANIISNYSWSINDGGLLTDGISINLFFAPGTTLTENEINNIDAVRPTIQLTRWLNANQIAQTINITASNTFTYNGSNQFSTSVDQTTFLNNLIDGEYHAVNAVSSYLVGYISQDPYRVPPNQYFLKWNSSTGLFTSAGATGSLFLDYTVSDSAYRIFDPTSITFDFVGELPK